MRSVGLTGAALNFRGTFHRLGNRKAFCSPAHHRPQFRPQHQRASAVTAEAVMADEDKKKKNQEKELIEEKKKEGMEELPPPPEKPLPDDCCGSGCVRCVWDVYYDELEAYNNRYKNTSESDKS